MSNTRKQLGGLVVAVALTALSAAAQTVYQTGPDLQNPSTGDWLVYNNSAYAEVGDRISLALSPGFYPLQSFSFEYKLDAAADKDAVLRLYANDGASQVFDKTVPGTLLYDSSWAATGISLTPGFGTATVTPALAYVPEEFTWTVQFNGLGAGEAGSLILAGEPEVGASAGDFWVKNAGAWEVHVLDNGNIPANFAAAVAVPEPATWQLGLMAGAGLIGLALRRRS